MQTATKAIYIFTKSINYLGGKFKTVIETGTLVLQFLSFVKRNLGNTGMLEFLELLATISSIFEVHSLSLLSLLILRLKFPNFLFEGGKIFCLTKLVRNSSRWRVVSLHHRRYCGTFCLTFSSILCL